MLRAKDRGVKPHVKPAVAAAHVGTSSVSEVPILDVYAPDVLAVYAPFIRDGLVSLIGGDVKVPVKILRNTGAYCCQSVSAQQSLSVHPKMLDRTNRKKDGGTQSLSALAASPTGRELY